MMRKWLIILSIMLAMLALPLLTAQAEPERGDNAPQVVYQTPTAMPDGRIIYRVKAQDTCISISLLNKISLDELRRLNGIQGEDCFLRMDQELLLGIVEAAPTPAPTASPTPLLPALNGGKGVICALLFNDLNGNGISEAGELAISGGAVSVNDRLGKVSLTGITNNSGAPLCFEDIQSGEYTMSMAVPDGYNATTTLTYAMNLIPGDTMIIDFGAQISTAGQPLSVSEGGRSPLLAILGGLLVLAGAALGIYFRALRRSS